jgi:branched-chain amino acid transport system substrate-binding protein
VISADHQNKADVGSVIARRWFDEQGVDVIADVPVSSVALAVQEIARQANRVALMLGTTSDLTGKACAPYSTQWADDTYSLSAATAKAVVGQGGKSWFFIPADYAFGQAVERDATAVIKANGGTVVGGVRHPLNTSDMSSFLLQAQASKAQVIALANAGTDLTNTLKQAAEFGIESGGQKVVGILMFATDVDSLGLAATQKAFLAEGFYWDQSDSSRAWSKRFMAKTGKMPTKEHAAVYTSVAHYLNAARQANTDEAGAVSRAMRAIPVDYFGRDGVIREDGRVIYPLSLYQVKTPAESKYPWDYYKEIQRIDGKDAFRPMADGGCVLTPSSR